MESDVRSWEGGGASRTEKVGAHGRTKYSAGPLRAESVALGGGRRGLERGSGINVAPSEVSEEGAGSPAAGV